MLPCLFETEGGDNVKSQRSHIAFTDIFTGVLGIIESGFSGTRVLKLSDLVLKTSESSFSESDCGNIVLDQTIHLMMV